MDRLNQLRGEAGTSRDSTLDTSSPPSESYMTANETSSKYFSLSEEDSTFDISPIKDVSSTLDAERTVTESDRLISNLSPIGKKDFLDGYKIGKEIEAAKILSGGVDIFEDNDNSYDGDELVIDDNVEGEDKSNSEMKIVDSDIKDDDINDATLAEGDPMPRKDTTEVTLQIDGRNVDAIDIGNGLYLYRRPGEEELAAVQIDEDQQQPNYKFLKVRENDEGNLEVYEEFQIEVPKEEPVQEGSSSEASVSHVPIKDIADVTCNKVTERKNKTQSEPLATVASNIEKDSNKDSDSKSEVNGKLMKICESKKSPVVGSFTPMTYHSTPNKEGIPLTKTMVDLQLHPNRHSDNVKKTIEVHTDSVKPKLDQLNKPTKDSEEKIKPEENTMESKNKNAITESGGKSDKRIEAPANNDNLQESPSINKITGEETIKEDQLKSNIIEGPSGSENKEDLKPIETASEPTNISSKPEEPEKSEMVRTEKLNKDSETEVAISDDNKQSEVSNINANELKTVNNLISSESDNLKTGVDQNNLQNETQSISTKSQDNTESVNVNNDESVTVNVVNPVIAEDTCKIDDSTENKIEQNAVVNAKVESNTLKTEKDIQTFDKNNEKNVSTTSAPNISDIKSVVKSDNSSSSVVATQSDNKINLSKTIIDKKLELKGKTEIVKQEKRLPTDIKQSCTADSTTNSLEKSVVPEKMDIKITPQGPVSGNIKNTEPSNKDSKPLLQENLTQNNDITTVKKTSPKSSGITEQKPISNNHAAVPFGKWTEANRQAFLNSIKETKVPSNSSNGKQLKNSNDLNRRDILKKIDSHRQTHTSVPSAKVQDFGGGSRLPVKNEASVFTNKPTTVESKLPVKKETAFLQANSAKTKKVKQEHVSKSQTDSSNLTVDSSAVTKKEATQRKEINNQDLIDKTIEDIINRALPVKSQPDNGQDVMTETLEALQNKETFDEIEKRMNELHGISSTDKAKDSHLPSQKILKKSDVLKVSTHKQSKIPNLLPFANKTQRKGLKENVIDVDSEEEVIEHEPITGDMDVNKTYIPKLPEKLPEKSHNIDNSKKEAIITEKDFDKFVRRNSVSYENCLTVNFDGKEPHNVVQTIVPKDTVLKTYSKQDHNNIKTASLKHEKQKPSTVTKPTLDEPKVTILHNEDVTNKCYQSKVKMAYQTAMTAKRHLERPITIIEDKPVKVVFMESNAEFIPKQLNAQGKELSPAKKQFPNIDLCNTNTSDSLDSDILELDEKSAETKSKTKHQRKQVLTPVDTPELELIEPDDLGINVTPKKKRKTEERVENSPKPVVPKKTYLLGRGTTAEDEVTKPHDASRAFETEPSKLGSNHISHNNTASAIDNLVKAAELLETQSENLSKTSLVVENTDSQQNTPVKRGRGRPRKYPLPEGGDNKTKAPTPQKKPRLSDTKMSKSKDTDDDDDDSSDGEIVRENWTMGKINENIVCPICSKLFRSENVVFKHVKHCTGPSPNRSDCSSRSPRRFRESDDFESKTSGGKSPEIETDDKESSQKDVRKKRKSRESNVKSNKAEGVEVEDTVLKSKADPSEERKPVELKKSTLNKNNISDNKVNNLICEFCGKTFRQLSYLVNHKLQHAKEDSKSHDASKVNEVNKSIKSVFSCEVCKKEFRKLHHLVQHRLIHNPRGGSSAKLLRKSSAEQSENRASKNQEVGKQSDDTSAGFRCERCDKSFRKLHHLVEHRETHDGINRNKNTTAVSAPVDISPPPPQCEICKKTFRKLHHLIEHKEQHAETSSEKSDDKSVKSSLSTKDIIHECPLCYMVFPNEHSLNKHTIICQRKKRQSAAKQNKPPKESEDLEEDISTDKPDEDSEQDNEVIIVSTEIISDKDVANAPQEKTLKQDEDKIDINPTVINTIDKSPESPKPNNLTEKPKDLNNDLVKEPKHEEDMKVTSDLPNNLKKSEEKEPIAKDTPKKKAEKVDKVASATKKHRPNRSLSHIDETKSMEASDDEEIRYMLNPNYKVDDNDKGKVFMKIRASKRNSLQIERPNSKDVVKRRISQQHPAKVPRLKPKLVQSKGPSSDGPPLTKNLDKISPVEPSTDSDDSDVKYSFPKISKFTVEEPVTKETEKKIPRKSMTEKRKSLSTIAKRKSLGKAISAKLKATPVPLKPIKKRTAEAEHRCDCGQLFSSAALLSRHTTLAHTPPRIRRRRSPPPDPPKQLTKPNTEPKPKLPRKSSVKDDAKPTTARSGPQKTETKIPDARKSLKSSEPNKSATKVRSYTAHKGVPIPEKMRKMFEKCKK